MPVALTGSAACVVGDDIYVFGGYPDDEEDPNVDTVYRYDVGANEWSTCASMPEARYESRACTMGGMVYVVGGRDKDDVPVASVFGYDLGSDSWSELAPIPVAMASFGLDVLAGQMHAVNGPDSFAYDSSANSWSAGQCLNTPRQGLQACVVMVEVDLFDAMIARARSTANA
jgi:N-acetylneuraminic acid mutarotase